MQPPLIVTVLGWAGVAPFAALSGTIAFGGGEQLTPWAVSKLVPYAAIILTFMGGVHWGLIMNRETPDNRMYVVGIAPSLVAVAAIFVEGVLGLILLAAGFLALVIYDVRIVGQKYAPQWYATLRMQLTAAVVTCLTVAAVTA